MDASRYFKPKQTKERATLLTWLILILVQMVGSNEIEQLDERCVSTTSCESIMWLVGNKVDYRTFSTQDIPQIVKNMACGLDRVLCFSTGAKYFAQEESDSEDYDYYDYVDHDYDSDGCRLQILFRINDLAPEIDFTDSTNQTLGYLGIQAESESIAYEMLRAKNVGQCRWTGFEAENMTGRSMTIEPEQELKLDFDWQSLRKHAKGGGG
eukprot:maker-scaffold130_size324016-snap-gene-1.14 protein:Tk07098 transcript:maker-scaffold130_size324016-snap-gene-1.14-mRNA-1 annotation:"toll-like receptor 2-like"